MDTSQTFNTLQFTSHHIYTKKSGFLSVYRDLMDDEQLYLQEMQNNISLNIEADLIEMT
jgi:hypothetical protein